MGFTGTGQSGQARHKVALARLIVERLHLTVDPDALFDVQIKRIQ